MKAPYESGINKDFTEKSTDWIATDGKRCTDVVRIQEDVARNYFSLGKDIAGGASGQPQPEKITTALLWHIPSSKWYHAPPRPRRRRVELLHAAVSVGGVLSKNAVDST